LSGTGADVTDAFNSLIRRTPDGGELTLPYGDYRVNGTVFIDGRSDLVIAGVGARLISDMTPRLSSGAHVVVSDCTNVAIHGLTIIGDNDYRDPSGYSAIGDYFAEHGISVRGGSGTTVTDVTVNSVYGDGIYVGGVASTAATATTIANLTVAGAGRHGVSLVRALGVVIDGLDVQFVGSTGVDLEPNSIGDSVLDVSISNFLIRARTIPLSAGGQFEVSNVEIGDGELLGGFVGRESVIVKQTDGVGVRSNWAIRNVVRSYGFGTDVVCRFERVNNVTVDLIDASFMAAHWKYVAGVEFVDCGGSMSVTGSDWGAASHGPFVAVGTTDAAQVTSSGNTWNSGASSD
jgi:hypothetical protein